MSMLLAIIAFVMAFGALWFTSEIARRADARGKILVKPHLTNVKASLQRAEREIRELSRALETAEREIKSLKSLRLRELEADLSTSHTAQVMSGPSHTERDTTVVPNVPFRPTGSDG